MGSERVRLTDIAHLITRSGTVQAGHGGVAPASVPPVESGSRSYETPQFAFVPVGLSSANLAWSEGVIARLKQRGDRQASRSKIIRALIERYGKALERDLLGPEAIPPCDHTTRGCP